MRRRKSVRLPRSVVLAAIVALVVGYVPLTGLDHLHLHIDHGLEFFHDHLHIGHHEHGHSHDHSVVPDDHDGESEDEPDLGAAVVTLGHAAQVQPPSVEVQASATPVAERTWLPDGGAPDLEPLHPSWNSRAPPV